ncbi:MAG: NUDIX hydrolase [Spirochaetales bacterium]|nr:NUDIX hydrolase [Spirochaetales bacterium]
MKSDELMWQEVEEVDRRKEPLFDLITVKSRSADGTEANFIKVTPPDWVTVIPVLPDGRILMVRQYRHGIASLSEEFPAGVVDAGEDALQAAHRELEEETGYVAGEMIPIGKINPNPAFMTNTSYTYLARDLKKVSDQSLDEHERIEFFTLDEKEIEEKMGGETMASAIMVQAWYWYQSGKRAN